MTLIDGARTAIKWCLRVKPRERVLIITDPEKKQIGEALFKAAEEQRAEAMCLKMLPRKKHGEEPPELVAEAMKHADVIIAPTTYSLSHTQARKAANKKGARIATMPGMTIPMMSKGGMTADFKAIEKKAEKIHKVIRRGKEVHITTALGTDLRFSIKGRKWIKDTGILNTRGAFGNLPAGEIFIPPLEGTSEGVLFVDGSFLEKVTKPARIDIKDGFATKITNAQLVKKSLDSVGQKGRNVAEFGIGLNPAAKIIGNVLEDEKVLGTIHIAFGDNSTFGGKTQAGVHIDGIVKKPTVVVDDITLLDKGNLKY